MSGTYGIDVDANLVSSLLLSATPIAIDSLDLTDNIYKVPSDVNSPAYQQINALKNADFTTGSVEGTGIFDVMMQGMKAQLTEEYSKGRITGAEYTKAYVGLVQITTQNAVQFLLGRDAAYWASVQAQIDSVTKRVQLEVVKYQAVTARLEAETAKQNLALTKAKLGTEDAQYGQLKFQIDSLLPQQLLQSVAQVSQLNAQVTLTTKQLGLITEQIEVQRAQTLDIRTDGTAVSGSVGAQKLLYAQQVISYKRDAEVKAAKLFTDAWTVQKTIDEGLVAPNGFTNASVDTVLSAIKTNNALV